MESQLKKLLEELNITGNEARVYLACLELGPTTITKIARKAEIERATVYAILERLREKGLFSENTKDYDRRIQVESPDKLLILARRKKEAIEHQEKEFKSILPDLLSQVNQKGKQPKVKFYEGKEQYMQIFDQSVDEAKEKMYFFGNVDKFIDMVSWDFEKEWIKRRLKRKVAIDILVNKGRIGPEYYVKNDQKELRETRFAPSDMNFDSSFLLWSNKIALWNPLVPLAILIEDETIVAMFFKMFKGLWGMAK